MLTKIKQYFSPKRHDRLIESKFNDRIELEKGRLESSLQLLKQTTNEVSSTAVNAAIVLERRLRDTECRFFSTIDTINDLVIVKDGEGRWKTLNKVGQDLLGWHHREYYDKTDIELIQLFTKQLFSEELKA